MRGVSPGSGGGGNLLPLVFSRFAKVTVGFHSQHAVVISDRW